MNKEAKDLSNTTLTKLVGTGLLLGLLHGVFSHGKDTRRVNKFEDSLHKKKPLLPDLDALSKQSFLDANTAKAVVGVPLGIAGSSYLTHSLLDLLAKKEQQTDIKKLEKEIAEYLEDDSEITDVPVSMLARLSGGRMGKQANSKTRWFLETLGLDADILKKILTGLIIGIPAAGVALGGHARYKSLQEEEPTTKALKKTVERQLGESSRFTPGSDSFRRFIEQSTRPIQTSEPDDEEDDSGVEVTDKRTFDEALVL